MENKGLLSSKETKENIEQYFLDINFQRRQDGNMPLWRRAVNVVTGYAGLLIISLIATFVVFAFTKNEAVSNGIITYVSYGALFLLFLGLNFKNIKTLFKQFLDFGVICRGILFGLLVMFIPALFMVFINPLIPNQSVNSNETTIREMIKLFPWLTLFFAGVIGPICEEFTYRIGLFGLLRKKRWVAYVATCLVFGLIHFDFTAFSNSTKLLIELGNLPSYMISGLILAYAYDRYGFAVACYAHIFNNAISILYSIF